MSSTIKRKGGDNNNNMKAEILDEDEQEKIIQDLKKSASDQVQFNRSLFAVVFGIIAGIFLICAFYTVQYPWEMEHQKHFKEILPTWAFICYYMLSSVCFFIAAFTVKNPQHTRLVYTARALGLIVGLFALFTWLRIFYMHSVTNPIFYWMPLADILGLLLALYVDFDSNGLIQLADGLEKYKYENKSA